MRTRASILLLLMVSFFYIPSVLAAETFEMKEAGISFEIPDNFSRFDKSFRAAKLENAIVWQGPRKGPYANQRWEFKFIAKKLIKLDGWGASQQFEQEYSNNKANQFYYESVEPMNIQGAMGAYFSKEVIGANTINIAWHAVAYSYDYRFEWVFSGEPSTMEEYNMVIQQLLKSVKITAAQEQPKKKDEFIRDF
ncbi:MAG: hypothetical protein LWY06_17000 [Firmicutes bacterium]|nr:hypothetical protein [Bacillota bacterium]